MEKFIVHLDRIPIFLSLIQRTIRQVLSQEFKYRVVNMTLLLLRQMLVYIHLLNKLWIFLLFVQVFLFSGIGCLIRVSIWNHRMFQCCISCVSFLQIMVTNVVKIHDHYWDVESQQFVFCVKSTSEQFPVWLSEDQLIWSKQGRTILLQYLKKKSI
jgi:hypothetical protein